MKKLILFLMMLFWSTGAWADITTGLVGWWKFDEASSGTCQGTASILDSSGSGNTGTCSTLYWPTWVAGKIGLGAILSNSGGSNIYMGVTNLPKVEGSKTIAFWAYSTDATYTQTWVSLYLTNNDVQVDIRGGDWKITDYGGNVLLTGPAPSINAWHHICYTYDGTNHILYIDASTSWNSTTAGQSGTPTEFDIFYYKQGSGNVSGTIDDLRIYNRALTSSDVTQLYNYTGATNHGFTRFLR